MTQERTHTIFIVSDATGETAERVTKAAIKQFQGKPVALEYVRHVRSVEQVEALVARVREEGGVVVHTLVSAQLREHLEGVARDQGVPTVDLIGSLLYVLTNYLKAAPESTPGITHRVNAEYFRWIEAIEFTVQHDDGRHLETVDQADIVLVGVSRTSKTPLSIYLGNRGYRVANVPVVLGMELPEALFRIAPSRIVGLTVAPDHLRDIRLARLQRLRQPKAEGYADEEYLARELAYGHRIFQANPGWKVLDVTRKAVEEAAAEIESHIKSRGLAER